MKAELQAVVLEHIAPVLEDLRRIDLVQLYRRNRAQLILGLRALDILDTFKQRDRVLDFGDLEDMACTLMGDRARALSLLFRLEDSIRHVLVDEFQDTNFNQWDILAPFVDEFLAGGGAEARPADGVPGRRREAVDLRLPRGRARDLRRRRWRGFARPGPAHADPAHQLPQPAGRGRRRGPGVRGRPPEGDLPAGEAAHVHQSFARKEAGGVMVLAEAYQESEDGRTADQVAADAAARLVRDLVDRGATTWEGLPLRSSAPCSGATS